MHRRLFTKKEITLNECKNIHDLLSLLCKIGLDQANKYSAPNVVVYSDHMLVNEQGWQGIKLAQEINAV